MVADLLKPASVRGYLHKKPWFSRRKKMLLVLFGTITKAQIGSDFGTKKKENDIDFLGDDYEGPNWFGFWNESRC